MTSHKSIIDAAIEDWNDRVCEKALGQLNHNQDWIDASHTQEKVEENLRYNDIVAYGGVENWWLCVENDGDHTPNVDSIGCVKLTPVEIQTLYERKDYKTIARMLWRVIDKDSANRHGEVESQAPVRLQSVYNGKVYGVTWCTPRLPQGFQTQTSKLKEAANAVLDEVNNRAHGAKEGGEDLANNAKEFAEQFFKPSNWSPL